MRFRLFISCILLSACTTACADEFDDVIQQAMAGLDIRASKDPYSRTIERMYIAYDKDGNPKTGIAMREIESYKPITGVVIVDKTDSGFVLREALFPDIDKIKKAKDRMEVQSILKQFKNIPFDPYAEHSAVDAVSGATRYYLKASGYLNYMARKTALQMDTKPNWPKKK